MTRTAPGDPQVVRAPAVGCQVFAWSLVSVVSTLAVVVWGRNHDWDLGQLSPYQVFPLLGLLAFSIMWSHYVSAFVRQALHLPPTVLSRYLALTSYAVLALICLHPAILVIQRYRDGFGLPPSSYESYVGPGLGWVTLLGTFSLFVFLAFEFRKKFGQRSWWRYVLVANDVAMLSVLYHGLRIGGDIQGWFRSVWLIYGAVLAVVLVHKYTLLVIQSRRGSAATDVMARSQ